MTSSLREDASLSPFGRLAAGWDLKRMLSTLLILADAEREDPAILMRPLASPIFITGLPRSGTTFLHGLLAAIPSIAPLAYGRRSTRVLSIAPPSSARGAGRLTCSSVSSTGYRQGSGTSIQSRRTRRRNASKSRARCSAARATMMSIALRPIAPGSTHPALTKATNSLRGFFAIFRGRPDRHGVGS